MTRRRRRTHRLRDPGLARARFDPVPRGLGPTSRLVHGARRPERNAGAVVPPIYQTTTFHFPEEFSEAGREDVRLYTRDLNPTQEVAAELIRQLEGGETARVFASGMGAISSTLIALLRAGDEVVTLDTLYGGSLELLSRWLPRYGVRVRWLTLKQAQYPARALSRKTRVLYLESPTNPLLNVHDIRAWADAAHSVDALLVVDNTFATPINQRPLELGADMVVHSATKYLGGHADLMAGAVVGPRSHFPFIDSARRVLGPVLDPFAAFLLIRGLRTLPLRIARQNSNGEAIGRLLSAHPAVRAVHYPGLASPREEEIARRQMQGRGGMLSLELRGGAAATEQFIRGLRLAHVASSLGGVETLVSVPARTSHRHLGSAQRRARGIADGLVRISLGIEDTEDLERDFARALGRL